MRAKIFAALVCALCATVIAAGFYVVQTEAVREACDLGRESWSGRAA